MEVCRDSSKPTYTTKIVSTTKTPETTYLRHTECHLRGSRQCASGSIKNSSWCTVESNAPLDVLIVMPEHSDGSSESEETKDTAEVELNSCQTGANVHAHIDETSWHVGETKTSS